MTARRFGSERGRAVERLAQGGPERDRLKIFTNEKRKATAPSAFRYILK